MKIVITCGPSFEPIDEVRRLTNFSTGRLGVTLANAFTDAGWEVFCFKGEQASYAGPLRASSLEGFSTNEDLARRLEALSRRERIDVILHAAALCDFRIEQVTGEYGETLTAAKLPSRAGKISLLLAPAPKVLLRLREWFPQARIVGWKYELVGTRAEAFAAARRQIQECGTDACVLNGAAHGAGFTLCTAADTRTACADADTLATCLLDWLRA